MDRMAEQTGQLVDLIGFEGGQLTHMVDQTGQWVGLAVSKAD